MYTLAYAKEFPAAKIGKHWRIPRNRLEKWVDGHISDGLKKFITEQRKRLNSPYTRSTKGASKKEIEFAILTVSETAAYLRVSQSSVYDLIKKDEYFPSFKIGSWRIHKGYLDEWILYQIENKPINYC